MYISTNLIENYQIIIKLLSNYYDNIWKMMMEFFFVFQVHPQISAYQHLDTIAAS